MIFRRQTVDTFKQQFPDYPVKNVPLTKSASIWFQGGAVALGLVAMALLLLFGLSKLKVPRALVAGPDPAEREMTEDEMFRSLSAEQLHPIGQTCAENDDPACAKTVFTRILELNPNDLLALGSLAMAEASLGLKSEAVNHMEMFNEKGGPKSLKKSKVTRFIKGYLKDASNRN